MRDTVSSVSASAIRYKERQDIVDSCKYARGYKVSPEIKANSRFPTIPIFDIFRLQDPQYLRQLLNITLSRQNQQTSYEFIFELVCLSQSFLFQETQKKTSSFQGSNWHFSFRDAWFISVQFVVKLVMFCPTTMSLTSAVGKIEEFEGHNFSKRTNLNRSCVKLQNVLPEFREESYEVIS